MKIEILEEQLDLIVAEDLLLQYRAVQDALIAARKKKWQQTIEENTKLLYAFEVVLRFYGKKPTAAPRKKHGSRRKN